MGYTSEASFGSLDDWAPVEPLREAIKEFRSKWMVNNKELAKMWGIPPQTIQGIITVGKKDYVKPATARKIMDGIKNYDPRTCNYRRIEKNEAAKIFRQMKKRSGLTWAELAKVVGAPSNVLWDMVTPTSQRKSVQIGQLREYIINFQQWELERSRTLISEGVA